MKRKDYFKKFENLQPEEKKELELESAEKDIVIARDWPTPEEIEKMRSFHKRPYDIMPVVCQNFKSPYIIIGSNDDGSQGNVLMKSGRMMYSGISVILSDFSRLKEYLEDLKNNPPKIPHPMRARVLERTIRNTIYDDTIISDTEFDRRTLAMSEERFSVKGFGHTTPNDKIYVKLKFPTFAADLNLNKALQEKNIDISETIRLCEETGWRTYRK